MEEKRDYYAVLGISKGATEADIKKAYRKLARKYHSDQNPENPDEANLKFNEAREAYDILSDSKKRADYDSNGAYSTSRVTRPNSGGFNPQRPSGSPFGDLFGNEFARYFEEKMGTGETNITGRDVRVSIQINHNEAVSGTKKELNFDFSEICTKCGGIGSIAAAKGVCKNCGGSGMEKVSTKGGFGSITRSRQCSTCHGKGQSMEGACPICAGSGFVKVNKTIMLEVPKGIKSGQAISLKGLGEPGKDCAMRGKLVVNVSVR